MDPTWAELAGTLDETEQRFLAVDAEARRQDRDEAEPSSRALAVAAELETARRRLRRAKELLAAH